MAVARIDDDLLKEIQTWLKENGNRYKIPTVTAFINNAVYEKLTILKEGNHEPRK